MEKELVLKKIRDVGIVADFGNISQAGGDFIEFLKKYANRVSHVHVKDVILTDSNESQTGLKTLTGKYMHEAEVGKGIVDMKSAFKILKNSGYNGYYALEYGAPSDDSPAIRDAIEFINSLL